MNSFSAHKASSLGALAITSACVTASLPAQSLISSISLGSVVQVAAPETIAATTSTFYSGNLSFAGQSQSITNFTTSQGVFTANGQASSSIFVRRAGGDPARNFSTAWYQTNGSSSSYSAARAQTYTELLHGNNILRGGDNVFVNGTGSSPGNIERLDFVFSSGIEASSQQAFAVFERGGVNLHDGFKIALITGWDPLTQSPTSYSVFREAAPNWGGPTNVTPNTVAGTIRSQGGTLPVSYTDATLSGSPVNNVGNEMTTASLIGTSNNQGLGGIAFTLADFGLTTGQQVFGYSLFGYDVIGQANPSGGFTPVLDWTLQASYPRETVGTAFGGGLDLAGVNGILFSVIPEPSTFALGGVVMAAFGAALRRRPRASLGTANSGA